MFSLDYWSGNNEASSRIIEFVMDEVDASFKNYLGAWIWISSNVGDLRRTCIGCEHSLDGF